MKPAVLAPEPPKPVEVVEVPTPLPLPGQLQPPPQPVPPDTRPPTARVDAANRAALHEPTRDGWIDAVQVYPYTPGALYRLYAAPEQVSDVGLQPGEQLVAIAAGDTVRWVVGDTTSGAGDAKQVHVLVKPFAPGVPVENPIRLASWGELADAHAQCSMFSCCFGLRSLACFARKRGLRRRS